VNELPTGRVLLCDQPLLPARIKRSALAKTPPHPTSAGPSMLTGEVPGTSKPDADALAFPRVSVRVVLGLGYLVLAAEY
jgi:hypothetical protein